MAQLSMTSPVGDITVAEEDGRIVSVDWGRIPAARQQATPLLARACAQLEQYFDGELTRFDLPLAPAGSPFHRSVWAVMLEIPYGGTLSYGEIATRLGNTARAVGRACGANPIPIIIPCHRVLAAGGALGGYSGDGGLVTKQALLRLEGALLV